MCGVAGRWDDLRRDRAYQRERGGASKNRVFPSGEMAATYNVVEVLTIRVCREMPRKKDLHGFPGSGQKFHTL